MGFFHPDMSIKNLKRDLTMRFAILLSVFLILLIISYIFSSISVSSLKYDRLLLNAAGRQRMLIHQYTSEINQTLIGLATLNLKMALLEKKKADLTVKQIEDILKAFADGGEIIITTGRITDEDKNTINLVDKHIVILPINDKQIQRHLSHVNEKWQELKRIALLSLRSNKHQMSESPYIHQLLDHANQTVAEMDHVVQLMQFERELKLKHLDTLLLLMVIIGSVIFLILVYFVSSRIVTPLDGSIKALHQTTEKLEIEKTRAESANAAKSKFLSRMSHELRTPLNAILGFGQLLKMDAEGFNEIQRDNVKEILDAGEHLLGLINEVLDLAKIEAGKLQIAMDKVSVDEVMQQSISLIGPLLASRHIELTDHISGKGYIVQADITRLKQVLVNLLSNAVKYNRENGYITLDSELMDKQRIRIRVTDSGEGLTEEDIVKLFTPFERLDNVNNVEGVGIGLVITRHLVELMGGTIGIESTPGEGCTFWVEFALTNQAAIGKSNE